MRHRPPIHLPITINLDPSMPKSLVRGKSREMRKKAGTTTSQDVGSGEDCTIYKDEGSIEEEDDNTESNKALEKIAESVISGISDFVMSSPNDDHKGSKESEIGGLEMMHNTRHSLDVMACP